MNLAGRPTRAMQRFDQGGVMSGRSSHRPLPSLLVTVALIAVTACASPTSTTPAAASPSPSPSADEIRVGAVFPLVGNAAGLAKEELAGVQAAADFVNADGGIDGRRIVLDVRDLESATDAPAVMTALKAAGSAVVVGAYSSALSIPASQAASDAGIVYWEAGAVADRLTGRGLPLVFRVGASGTNLGSNSARFAATELAPRLAKPPAQLRVAIVAANDDYAKSVADAAAATAGTEGTPVVSRTTYDLTVPDFPGVMTQLKAARPDVLILASHIPDGVAFRRAMLAANLRVAALIGSTMAECDPDFAGDLGPDAVGIFASDRPTGGFQPSALDPAAHALYGRFAAAWAARGGEPHGSGGYGSSGEYGSTEPAASAPEYTISGPVEAGSVAAGPSEEGLSGFSAAWALFHDVLPVAARSGPLGADAIAAAARSIDLPTGALPNGAGLHFSADPATLGQNERATAVIWQWQAVRSYTFVWPPTYRTGDVGFVPLDR
jgi:branched-chain amino acid transport system substrate-binding protein